MKNQEFKSFLFRSAVIAMACDGNIAEREIDTIRELASNEIYFLGLDYDDLLRENVNEIKSIGKIAINNYLSELSTFQLNMHQELQLIEVVLQIINADEQTEESELKFLHLVKSKLKVDQETLIVEFPNNIDQLLDFKNYGLHNEFTDEVNFNE
jgi:uncharacterized tellurite resistance protein B-like protein